MKRMVVLFWTMLMLCAFAQGTARPRNRSQNQTRSATQQSRAPQQHSGFQAVAVIGKGETLEAAREDAKRNALVTVVGEAIKARTDIREDGDNATVVSQFLAASAGFISKFAETSTGQEDGIFVVKANVTVYSDKLLEAVTFGNSSEEADKEMQEARVGSDIEATREALTKFICSYMLDYCRIWSITVNKIIPDYDNNGQPVLYVNGRFGTTPAKYQMYTRRLDRALARIGAKKARWDFKNYKTHNALSYCQNLDTQKKHNDNEFWTWLWISKKYMEPLQAYFSEIEKWGYLISMKLLDENGEVVKESQMGITFYNPSTVPYPSGVAGSRSDLRLRTLHGEHTDSCYSRKIHFVFKEFASSEEMLKVKRAVFFVEPVRQSKHPLVKFHQYLGKPNNDAGFGWADR